MRSKPTFPARQNTRASLRRSAVAVDAAGASALRTLRTAVLALVAGAATGLSACADATASGGPPRFQGSAPSIEILGRQVLSAFQRGDTATLALFRLSKEEHNASVWPELPASAPEVNYPVDLAWQNIELRNRRAVGRQRGVFEGRGGDLRRVECRGEVRIFETFRVHTDCWVVFRASGGGAAWEVQLFKDVVERGGGFKVFRYYDEPPRRYRGGPLA